MLKRLVFIAVMLSFVFGASIASAYPIVDLREVRVDNAATVNIHADGLGDTGAYAGNYILSVINPSGSGNTPIEYSGYCVEPAYSSGDFRQYALLPIAEGSYFEAAAWILSQEYTTQAPQAQVAVWELTWDKQLGFGFDLAADNFRLSPSTGTFADEVKAIYDAAIANMGGDFDQSCYVIAHNPVGSTGWEYSQDYIIPNPVPIPPTALLLGSGLLALVGLKGRRRFNKS